MSVILYICLSVYLYLYAQAISMRHTSDLKETNKTEGNYIRRLAKHQEDCIDLTKVDPNKVLKLKAGQWGIESKTIKLWTLCVLNKMGLMSTEGVFKQDEALATIPDHAKEDAVKIIDKCLTPKALPPHEIAWQYAKCHHKIDKNHNYTTLSIIM